MSRKGNCQIYYTFYTGDGTNSRTLTFPQKPQIVFVMGDNILLHAIQGAPKAMCKTSGENGAACTATWSGNSLTWTFSADYAYEMCNRKGAVHQVVALTEA